MSDKRERTTLRNLPQAGVSARVGQLLVDPPRASGRALSPAQKTAASAGLAPRKTRTSAEQRRNLEDTVNRLLAKGAGVEETLAQVCAALRDIIGWSEVIFQPFDRRAYTLPSARAVAPLGKRHAQAASAQPTVATAGVRYAPHAASTSDTPSSYAFPVRGSHDLLGVIECFGEPRGSPDPDLLSVVAALGAPLGRAVEQQRAGPRRAPTPEQPEQTAPTRASSQRSGQFDALFTALPESVIAFDHDGRILQTNAADGALLGYDAGANRLTTTLAERRRALALRDAHGRPIEEAQSPAARILRGETLTDRQAVEATIRTLDGSDIQVSFTGAPTIDEAGAVTGGVVVMRDITARGRSEHEPQDFGQRLTELLGDAAHELKTPIASSKGSLQLAIKRLGSVAAMAKTENLRLTDGIKNVHKNLALAERSTHRLELYVDRLLDVTRIQTDKLDLRTETTNLAEIVRTAVYEQRLVAPKRVIRCTVAPTRVVQAIADSMRVGQVVMNYLANALKYSPEDSRVVVALQVSHMQARVSVHDEGAGIAPEKQQRIWSRFEQLDDTTQRNSNSGLGLGLYISRAIIEAHGGKVGVTSAVGHGATFWFSLPLASATA